MKEDIYNIFMKHLQTLKCNTAFATTQQLQLVTGGGFKCNK